MIRGLALICSLCLLAATHSVVVADCLVCPEPAEDSMVVLINAYRATNNVPPLTADRRLVSSARRHAADLLVHDFLSLTGSDGSSPEQRRSEAGYFQPGATNVVVNSPGTDETFALLLTDPETAEDFIDPSFRHIGVGFYADQFGAATTAWVIDYGSDTEGSEGLTCRTIYCPSGSDKAVLVRINALRADNSLAPIEMDDRLVESAQIQACLMTTYNNMSDSSLLGLSSEERMNAVGYESPGPTLTAVMSEDPVALFAFWENDPTARGVLIDPSLTHVGIRYAATGVGPVPNAWVADFGSATTAAVAPDCDCCVGLRGNIDGDADETINLTDLTVLVNALFVTFDPIFCEEEANVNGDPEGAVSLTDLTMMVNHLFVTFEPMAACP